jgi:hypothetical protein
MILRYQQVKETMITIEKLKQVTVIYVHGKCPDGLASAMILKDAYRMLGMNPKIEFIVHGTYEHKNAGIEPGCPMFCDIVPSEYARQYVSSHEGIVLDHHKGAEDIVRSFGKLGIFADEKLQPGVSGAVLAFNNVFAPIFDFSFESKASKHIQESAIHKFDLTRNFAICVGARDTWQTQSQYFKRGQYITKMLMSKPASWWLAPQGSSRIAAGVDTPLWPEPFLTEQEIEIGCALFESHEETVRQAVEQCVYSILPNETELYVFQEQACGFRLCSDVAEALLAIRPGMHGIVAGFSYVVDKPHDYPRLLFSLRGTGGFDVGTFAKTHGGGGHTAAAGFSARIDDNNCINPYQFIAESLRSFLV